MKAYQARTAAMFNSLLQSARSLVASTADPSEATAAAPTVEDDTSGHTSGPDSANSGGTLDDSGSTIATTDLCRSAPPAGFVFACNLSTLPVNQRRCLSLDKRAVVVYRNRAQRGTARSSQCPDGYTNIVADDGSEVFTLDAICYHMGVNHICAHSRSGHSLPTTNIHQ